MNYGTAGRLTGGGMEGRNERTTPSGKKTARLEKSGLRRTAVFCQASWSVKRNILSRQKGGEALLVCGPSANREQSSIAHPLQSLN